VCVTCSIPATFPSLSRSTVSVCLPSSYRPAAPLALEECASAITITQYNTNSVRSLLYRFVSFVVCCCVPAPLLRSFLRDRRSPCCFYPRALCFLPSVLRVWVSGFPPFFADSQPACTSFLCFRLPCLSFVVVFCCRVCLCFFVSFDYSFSCFSCLSFSRRRLWSTRFLFKTKHNIHTYAPLITSIQNKQIEGGLFVLLIGHRGHEFVEMIIEQIVVTDRHIQFVERILQHIVRIQPVDSREKGL